MNGRLFVNAPFGMALVVNPFFTPGMFQIFV